MGGKRSALRECRYEKLAERKRNKGELELFKRLDESVTSAKKDLQPLREILDRI
jgi:hypothetical protein